MRHNLFLAAKEALNNAVRHSRATEVKLRMAISEQSLVLTIEDNGSGFDRPLDDFSGNGLRNIRQRMEAVAGRFEVQSTRETGTTVTLTCFWPPAE